MRQFAEDEIVIPDGPYAGRAFRCTTQPYTSLWFDAVDSDRWNRFVATGPTQSGKTLCCFVITLLYHLFEIRETVICGLPDMEMATDKWLEDILPVIERTAYRELLPRKGAGSRGGKIESIRFENGSTLKFMSGGGSDKSRAGFTSRVVVITETDGMDRIAVQSREADQITQIEARTRAYGRRKRVYMECTVSTEDGRTWREYTAGTRSNIVMPCVHCGEWVAPERENLKGWQGAKSAVEAGRNSKFTCPACQGEWTEAQRKASNLRAQLLHVGQEIAEDGRIVGDEPETETLGFRWSAVHNMFLSAADFGADEWRASKAADEDNAEREMCQFVWCVPVSRRVESQSEIDVAEITSRVVDLPKGVVPEKAECCTCAVDVGKYLCHWVLLAWSQGATGHVVDYGRLEVATDDFGAEKALMTALREFRGVVLDGWPTGSPEGPRMVPAQVWVDAGYMTPVVHAFCRDSGSRFMPSLGRGAAQLAGNRYRAPKRTTKAARYIGEGFHVTRIQPDRVNEAVVDADYWKTWVHARLTSPMDEPGAMTLFYASPQEHLAFGKHLTAEKKTEEFVSGKGVVTRWVRMRRQNHWFDAMYNACAASHMAGIRLVAAERLQIPRSKKRRAANVGIRRPDGRPWIAR